MTTKEMTAPVDTSTVNAMEKPSTNTVAPDAPLVNSCPLHRLRLSKEIPALDMVAVVKELYPKFDGQMLSKLERPDEYGGDIREDAMSALYAAFAPEQRPRRKRKDYHRLTHRVSGRLQKGQYEVLQEAIKARNLPSVQEWIAWAARREIALYLIKKEEGADA